MKSKLFILFFLIFPLSAAAIAPIWWLVSIGSHVGLLGYYWATSETVTPAPPPGTTALIVRLDPPSFPRAPADWVDDDTPPSTTSGEGTGGTVWTASSSYASLYRSGGLTVPSDPILQTAMNLQAAVHAAYYHGVDNGSGFKGTKGSCLQDATSCVNVIVSNGDDTNVACDPAPCGSAVNTFNMAKVTQSVTCPLGYSPSADGLSCDLTQPELPTWETDGKCDMTADPDLPRWKVALRDPDCGGWTFTAGDSITVEGAGRELTLTNA
jgi:hypothetical protein